MVTLKYRQGGVIRVAKDILGEVLKLSAGIQGKFQPMELRLHNAGTDSQV